MDFGDDFIDPAAAPPAPADNGFPVEEALFVAEEAQVFEAPAAAAPAAPAPMGQPLDFMEPEPAAMPISMMDPDDPRRLWARKNADVLAQKEAAEQAAKMDTIKKAQEHLASFYEARKLQLTTRHSNVRSAEQISSDVTVPVGNTPWERVTSVINFNFEHQRDMSKYKTILLGCKAKNTPVNLRAAPEAAA